jgi:U3 small nucleolar RNA-associated protein 18
MTMCVPSSRTEKKVRIAHLQSFIFQLFFFDAPLPAGSSADPTTGTDLELEEGLSDEDEEGQDSEEDEEDSELEEGNTAQKSALKSRNIRQAAWYDPADEELQISLQGQKRLRKLRDAAAEDVVSGLDYENRLRRQ